MHFHCVGCLRDKQSIWSAGVDKAGKTTLLERLKTMYGDLPGTDPDKILPTVGLNVGRMQVHDAATRCSDFCISL